MDKRYQVFISSTYADLQEERRSVIQTIIESDCIPAGMEMFPAADEQQLEFIKKVIDDCDYYLLIIGGRYGSMTEDGISYTEKEYDYAVSIGLKVIALVHENPDLIPLGKSEKDPELRAKLQKFRDKVMTNRLVKTWKSADQLPGLVSLNLMSAIKRYPAVGWIRANRPASDELLTEVNELRKRSLELERQIGNLTSAPSPQIEDLAALDDITTIHGDYFEPQYRRRLLWQVEIRWREIFSYIAPYLDQYPNDAAVKTILTKALYAKSGGSERENTQANPSCNDQEFRTVGLQLKALGLVKTQYTEDTKGGYGLFWSLTPAGERLMMEVRTVRKPANPAVRPPTATP